jgi:hypothetical protein
VYNTHTHTLLLLLLLLFAGNKDFLTDPVAGAKPSRPITKRPSVWGVRINYQNNHLYYTVYDLNAFVGNIVWYRLYRLYIIIIIISVIGKFTI